MARIVQPSTWGSPDVLVVRDIPIPRAPDGCVVVRVRAAGVNPIDWKLYSGSFHRIADDHRSHAGFEAELPQIGLECAGGITALGAGVSDLKIGDSVIVYPVVAAYADYVVAPRSSIFSKPSSLSWGEAGSLMLAGTTAAHALHVIDLEPGETVLVHGGSGSVGLFAIQLAQLAGARVIATASERNHALLRDFGATPIVYGDGLLDRVREAAPNGVDAAVDTVGTDEALDVSLAMVQPPSRISSIAGSDRRIGTGVKILGNGPGQDMGTTFRPAIRSTLVDLAGAGDLRIPIAHEFPLSEASRAHWSGIRGHAPGNLVLIP